MSNDVAIEFTSVWKKFRKGERATALRDVIPNAVRWLRGRGGGDDGKDEFWALRDVSFEVRRGECLGIIGPNGAGKSTVLKILSGIMRQTRGEVNVNGRLAALIEVGAGFHPDLTGRENVYLNGSIMGLKRAEIDAKFDQIVDFSGVEEFIDTPLKRYSSGMQVRLGFSVAAHLDPDILLIDEVLSVGDMAFRAKCSERMEELKNSQIPIVFVSHNLHQISYLCSRTIVLAGGKVVYSGDTPEAIDVYRASVVTDGAQGVQMGTGEIEILRSEVLGADGIPRADFVTGEPVTFRIHYRAHEALQDPVFNVGIVTPDRVNITGLRTDVDGLSFGKVNGEGYVDLTIGELNLLPTIYLFSSTVFRSDGRTYCSRMRRAGQFRVLGGKQVDGHVYLPHEWRMRQGRLLSVPGATVQEANTGGGVMDVGASEGPK